MSSSHVRSRTRHWAFCFFLVVALYSAEAAMITEAAGQDLIPDTQEGRDEFASELNSRRIGIATGAPGGTYIQLGSDLSRLVQSATEGSLRVIVMEGRGSAGNLQDLVFLKFTDLALVQADVLAKIARDDPDDYEFLNDRLRLVARFHPEVIHVLARNGPHETLAALNGKRVAIGAIGSGTQITAPIVFDLLGLQPEYVPVSQEAAFADLLSDAPTIDGMVYVAGRGSPLFSRISPDIAQRIQDKGIFFVPFTRTPPEDSAYIADSISGNDYPSLIEQGTDVPVWAVPAVLAVYNWNPGLSETHRSRYERLASLIEVFFNNRGKLDDGPGGFNENWCTIDLASTVAGWSRFSAAQAWLDRNVATAVCDEQAVLTCEEAFAAEMREAGLDPQTPTVAALFDEWRERNSSICR